MNKITFEDFERSMSYDVAGNSTCIEIEFYVDGCSEYQCSWMGKMADSNTKNDIYWFGLVKDGSQAYDFDSFEKFANAKVFHGKNLKELWDLISIYSFGGGTIQETLPFYLEQSNY